MFISQSRVSQLTSALDRRIGVPLVARTSRRVQFTEFGAVFLAALTPSYRALAGVVEETRMRARTLPTPIRVAFQGAIFDPIAKVISQFES